MSEGVTEGFPRRTSSSEVRAAAVAETGGSITRAAQLLGLQPTYLRRLINKLDLRAALRETG